MLGVLFAYWAVRGLVVLAPANVPRLESVQFDGRTLLFTLVICPSAAILVGLAPGLQASRHCLAVDLTGAASRLTSSHRLRRVFVAVQVGLAFVLLVCAGLVGRSFLNLLRIDLGFNPTRVLAVDVELQDVPVARHTSFYERLLERVRTLLDVEAAAAVFQRPLEHAGIGMDGMILIEGQRTELQFRDWEQNPRVNLEAVTPGYFAAMGTVLLQGRDFSVADTVEAPRVAIVGERLASRLWPGENPIGKRIQAPGTLPDGNDNRGVWVSIVGVARDMRYRGLTDPRFDLYLPHTQSDLRVKHLMVRSSADPSLLAGAIRAEARRLEPAVLVENVEMMGDIIRAATAAWRFSASTLAILGALALALALVGIYATVSQSVVERTREIGIRVAVGAMPQHIRRLVLREGLGLALIGVAIGVVMAVAVVRIVSGLLFEVQRVDTPTLTATALVLLATSVLALGIPAWRAARVDPAVALRRP
jgi:putative ABC transport system permease protein